MTSALLRPHITTQQTAELRRLISKFVQARVRMCEALADMPPTKEALKVLDKDLCKAQRKLDHFITSLE